MNSQNSELVSLMMYNRVRILPHVPKSLSLYIYIYIRKMYLSRQLRDSQLATMWLISATDSGQSVFMRTAIMIAVFCEDCCYHGRSVN